MTQHPPSRLSPSMRLNLAQVYAAKGDLETAEKHVAAAYAEKPDLKDGYARIGWTAFWEKKDYDKVIEWMERDCRTVEQSDSQTAQPPDRSTAGPLHRLSPSMLLNLAQVHAAKGDLETAEKHVQAAYAEKTDLKDGYARIGWQYYSQKKDYTAIQILVKRDEDENRLSASGLMTKAKAIAKTDGIEPAIEIVEQAYRQQPELKNGFSQVAWARFIPEDMAYEKVIPYFEKDIERGALKGEWRLNYAQALAVLGREQEAEKVVEDAYTQNPNLKNGFGRIAIARDLGFYFNRSKAYQTFERDYQHGRLKGMCRIYHASATVGQGDIDRAIQLVEQAYEEDPTVGDGYACIGSSFKKENPQKAIEFFNKDKALTRLKPDMGNVLAGLYAYFGDRDTAEKMVEHNYALDHNIQGGYARVGFYDYDRNRDLDYLNLMIIKDDGLGRFNRPFAIYIQAMVKTKCGDAIQANKLLAQTMGCSPLVLRYAESWLLKSCVNGDRVLKVFIATINNGKGSGFHPKTAK